MPRHAPAAERRRASSILVGLAALTGMLALVIVVPVVLLTAWQALGPPIPSPRELTGPDDGTVFVRILCLVAWLAWASFTWATFAEILAQWRGWRLPAVGWQQRLAADLIAAVIVLFASPTVVSSVAAPVSVPAATAHPLPASGQSPADAHPRQQSGRAAYLEHHVQAGEQLPALAERYLGDKYRWQAIAAATYGLPQPDGRTLRPGDTRLYPGWTVRIPTSTALASSAGLASGTALTSGTAPASPSQAQTAPAAEQAPVGLGPRAVEYEAREGDWVWHIADRFLGDPDRYPDIAALNPHLARKYGAAFPDHIEPGDTLRLPADARDRGPRLHATGTTHPVTTLPGSPDSPQPGPAPAPAAPPAAGPQPPPASASAPTSPSPATSSAGTPSATTASPSGPTSTAPTTRPVPSASEPTHHNPAADQPGADHRGVDLGARGWVSTDLAVAVAAAAALVWIHRRRRYRPRPPSSPTRLDLDLAPLPAAVAALHGSSPTATTEDDMDDPVPHTRLAATVTHAGLGADATGQTAPLSDLPALGVGWTGPGAHDAARGLIASLLSAGGPWSPAAEATLITTRQTLTGLLPGADGLNLGVDPMRLQTTDILDQALSELERHLLRRARLAADPDLARDGIDNPDTGEPVLPPLVLLAAAPTGGTATRLAAILTVGSRLAITAVLLGDWPTGDTWHVRPDGTPTIPGQDTTCGPRLNILDEDTAAEILDTVRQAHPDDPDPHTTPPPMPTQSAARAAPVPGAFGTGAHAVERAPRPSVLLSHNGAASGTRPGLQLTVLGRPRVRVPTGTNSGDLRIRRSDGVALLVHFAVEPAGATSDELMALLWPQTRPQHSRRRFHTTLSELRHTLTDAVGADPVSRTQDRYHLDPALIDVDLWHLHAAVDRAATAVDPAHQQAALQEVIRRYTGPVAEGHTWLWLDPHREAVRRHVLDAHTTLAETEPDPRAALAIIQDAIRVDPYNENLYQRAMHLHAKLGSPDGVRTSLRTLTQRLAELEIPVSPATQHTASHLLERLNLRERLRPPT